MSDVIVPFIKYCCANNTNEQFSSQSNMTWRKGTKFIMPTFPADSLNNTDNHTAYMTPQMRANNVSQIRLKFIYAIIILSVRELKKLRMSDSSNPNIIPSDLMLLFGVSKPIAWRVRTKTKQVTKIAVQRIATFKLEFLQKNSEVRFNGFILLTCCISSIPKTLQVLYHLFRQWQVFFVEPFDLIDRRSSVIGKVHDPNLAMTVGDPHTNCFMM